jgi:hypothetical protein
MLQIRDDIEFLKNEMPSFIDCKKPHHKMIHSIMNDIWTIIETLISEKFLNGRTLQKMSEVYNKTFDKASEIDPKVTLQYLSYFDGLYTEIIEVAEEEEEFETASNITKFTHLIK